MHSELGNWSCSPRWLAPTLPLECRRHYSFQPLPLLYFLLLPLVFYLLNTISPGMPARKVKPAG